MQLQRKGDWMETYTGKQFWPIDPLPEEVCLDDIAHALSNTCRYGGHSKVYYSVAEHTHRVTGAAILDKQPTRIQLLCFLHDFSEAYINDIPRPTKPFLTNYYEIEDRIQNAIYSAFEIEPPTKEEHEIVKFYDNAVLKHEAENIMNNVTKWTKDLPQCKNYIEWYNKNNVKYGWSCEQAEVQLLMLAKSFDLHTKEERKQIFSF